MSIEKENPIVPPQRSHPPSPRRMGEKPERKEKPDELAKLFQKVHISEPPPPAAAAPLKGKVRKSNPLKAAIAKKDFKAAAESFSRIPDDQIENALIYLSVKTTASERAVIFSQISGEKFPLVLSKLARKLIEDPEFLGPLFKVRPEAVLQAFAGKPVLLGIVQKLAETNNEIQEGYIDFLSRKLQSGNFGDIIPHLSPLPPPVLQALFQQIPPALFTQQTNEEEETLFFLACSDERGGDIAISLIEVATLNCIRDFNDMPNKDGVAPIGVASEVLREKIISILGKKVTDEITQLNPASMTFGLIEPLLYFQPSERLIHELKSKCARANAPLLQQIAARYDQIEAAVKADFEVAPVLPFEIFKMANFFETRLPSVDASAGGVIKKRASQLAHTLQLSESGVVYILARHNVSHRKAKGTFNKVVSAAGVAFHNFNDTMKAVRRFTKPSIGRQEQLMAATAREMEILKRLKGIPGFVQLHTAAHYVLDSKAPARISAIFEPCSGDCEAGYMKKDFFAPQELISIQHDVLQGFSYLNKIGLLHLDIKPANLLLIRGQETHARISDFGLAGFVKPGKPVAGCGGYYNQGYYGSFWYTAPELFGIQGFAGDHFKVEAFAVGVTLYQMLHGVPPSWSLVIGQSYDQNHDHYPEELKIGDRDYMQYAASLTFEQKAVRSQALLNKMFQVKLTKEESCEYVAVLRSMKLAVDGQTHLDSVRLARHQQRVQDQITQQVEAQVKSYLQKDAANESFTVREVYEYVMLQLLRLDPKNRLTIDEAQALQNRLLQRVPQQGGAAAAAAPWPQQQQQQPPSPGERKDR